MAISDDVILRLTQHAQAVFHNPAALIDDAWLNRYAAPYGKTLKEVLEDPALGEPEVKWYMEFKANGGFE